MLKGRGGCWPWLVISSFLFFVIRYLPILFPVIRDDGVFREVWNLFVYLKVLFYLTWKCWTHMLPMQSLKIVVNLPLSVNCYFYSPWSVPPPPPPMLSSKCNRVILRSQTWISLLRCAHAQTPNSKWRKTWVAAKQQTKKKVGSTNHNIWIICHW